MTRTRQPSKVFIVGALALAACDESKLTPTAVGAAKASTGTVASATPKCNPKTAAGQAVGALLARRRYRDVAVSPDGTRIAYDVALDPIAAPTQRSTFVVDLSARLRTPERNTTGALDERALVFAPDGKHLALSARAGDVFHVSMVDLDTHASPSQLLSADQTTKGRLRGRPTEAELTRFRAGSIPSWCAGWGCSWWAPLASRVAAARIAPRTR
jgi:hypothetical protein